MLSPEDLERERELARIKLERDQLSRLVSARQEGYEQGYREGFEIGLIQAYQERLKQPVSSLDQLKDLSVEQLQQLAQQLERQLHQ